MDVYVVFDGPPGPESGRFIETEDVDGRGVGVGGWEQLPAGRWALVIPVDDANVRRADG